MKAIGLTILFALALIIPAPAKDRIPVPKEAEQTLIDYMRTRLFLKEHDKLGHRFSAVFKDLKVYKVWRDASYDGVKIGTGMQLYLVLKGDTTKVFEGENQMREYLVSLYKGTLKDKAAIAAFFKAIGTVDEVVSTGERTFHVFTGEKSFGSRSGYRLSLTKDAKIAECEHVSKLGE